MTCACGATLQQNHILNCGYFTKMWQAVGNEEDIPVAEVKSYITNIDFKQEDTNECQQEVNWFQEVVTTINSKIVTMFITGKDMNSLQNDPVEYIRQQYDFTETLFLPKNTV